MFEQSIAGHFWLWLKAKLVLCKASLFYNLILILGAYIKKCVLKSAILSWFFCPASSESAYGRSAIYGVAFCVVRKAVSLGKKLYTTVRKANENGISRCIISSAGRLPGVCFEYFCAALFAMMLIIPHESWNNGYAIGLSAVLAVMYWLLLISGQSFGIDVRRISVCLFAFAVASAGGAFMAPSRSDGVRVLLMLAASVIFMLTIWGSVSDIGRLTGFVRIMCIGLFVMCIYGLYQHLTGVESVAALTDLANNKGMPGRVYSTFGNPNNFAEAVVLLLPFLYALIITEGKKPVKFIWCGVLAVCVASLFMSYSRACYIAFAVSAVVFVMMYDWRLVFPLLLAGLVCIPFLPESVMNRILTIGSLNDTSNAFRVYLWDGVGDMLKDNWLMGVGLGPDAFMRAYRPYASFLALNAPHSHMIYLELFVELGIIGGVGFFGYMMSSVRRGIVTVSNASGRCRIMAIAAISSFAGIAFTGAAEYIWFYPRVMFLFWIVLSILLSAVRLERRKN